MRKISTLAVLAVVLLLSACSKESGEARLLESITHNGQITKFEYDSENRIVKMGTTTLTYKSEDLVIVDGNEYKRKDNVVVDGFITNNGEGTEEYKYTGGNLTKKNVDGGLEVIYKYDDKKSPFNCNTPKWVIQRILLPTYASKNNVIEEDWHDEAENQFSKIFHKYEYNSDGFPTKQTTGTETTSFKYCNLK